MNKQTTVGESRVWITALGLALGLAMTIIILGLITFYGMRVFWPKNVVTVSVPQELAIQDTGGKSSNRYLGIEMKRVEKKVPGKSEEKAPVSVQFYTANRHAYGGSFVFVLEEQLTIENELNKNVMLIERETDSRAMVLPVKLIIDDKEYLPESPEFNSALEKALDYVNDKRDQGRDIQDELHDLDIELKDYQLDLFVKKRDGLDTSLEEKEIARIQKLADEYSAAKNKLLEEQNKDTLVVKISESGMSYDLSVGNIIRYNFPNRLSTGGKFALFCDNIWEYVSSWPREANTEGGIFPAIIGTLVMTLIMCIPVTFFGVIAAIYLHEYAKDNLLTRAVRIAINNLAGVPSIVFGAFGLGFLIYTVGVGIDDFFFSDWKAATNEPVFGTGGLIWASLTLALMTLPVVIVSTEEALASVPNGLREGAMGCGATKWQSIWTIILPSSMPGIITGMILAMARGAGEVAPLMLVGVIKVVHALPIDMTAPFIHLDQKFMHLGFHIYDLGFQSPDSEAAKPMVYATTLFLILTVTSLNLAGIIIRQRLRKKYATGAF
ncbi:phosphate ABC transporter permease PstA [Lentisphaera marina]|uniref:phosphate ABC transporter permease PstA n=1 Tax=Lentisphaera marina TaxID=1111041 RepID=UPI0023651C0D|nr:phosphate ABC transporter permease PstA [Lentisphaera marina]MDD7985518.1 phosphate ABC transporter permease PstA [Lentisphaera marina]